jgi:hypothetical protein
MTRKAGSPEPAFLASYYIRKILLLGWLSQKAGQIQSRHGMVGTQLDIVAQYYAEIVVQNEFLYKYAI